MKVLGVWLSQASARLWAIWIKGCQGLWLCLSVEERYARHWFVFPGSWDDCIPCSSQCVLIPRMMVSGNQFSCYSAVALAILLLELPSQSTKKVHVSCITEITGRINAARLSSANVHTLLKYTSWQMIQMTLDAQNAISVLFHTKQGFPQCRGWKVNDRQRKASTRVRHSSTGQAITS